MGWVLAPAGLLALMAGLALLARTLRQGGRAARWLSDQVPLPLAALAGAAGSVVLQSSSLCVAGLVAAADGGAVGLAQAWAAVAGANVGTTLLPHLVAWEVPWRALAVAAAAASALCLHPRTARLGRGGLAVVLVLAGFRCLSAGLPVGVRPLALWVLGASRAPVLVPFVAGAALTAVLFSSHVTIALGQGLAASGLLAPVAGIAFVSGANVGTTADVLVASLGTGRRGRATAVFHLGFNLVLALLGLAAAVPFARALAAAGSPPARILAHAHTGLNLLTALLVLPWVRLAAAYAGGRDGAGRRPPPA